MKKVLILAAMFLLVIPNCSKKTTTNNYYYDGPQEGGTMVGVVHPPESQAQVTAYLGIPIASTQIDSVGYFKLPGLPAGDFKLLVQADGYRDYVSKPNIRVTDGAATAVDTIFLASIHDLILSVSPSDGAQGVKLSQSIRIYFHTPMNQAGFETAFRTEPAVEGTFRWSSSKPPTSVEFNPKYQLAANTRYQVTIDTTASDTAGIKMLQPYQFAFTTEPLRIEYTSPVHHATQVSPLTNILIAFNTDMDAASVISAFRIVDSHLEEVTGEFLWPDQQRVEFRPHSALAAGETYTVTINTTASDIWGAKLPEPYQFSFTTESVRVERTTPRHNETQVSAFTKILIGFNTDMDIESVNSAFSMVDSELNGVTGEFDWSSLRSMEFRPNSPLAADETYAITIDTSASGIQGTRLPEPYQFSFTTAPITIASRPGNNDREVSPWVTIKIIFNTYMMPGSVTATFKMVDSHLQDVTGSFQWIRQNEMWFRPGSALASNEQYTVTIDTTASDLHGAKLPERYQFSFTTAPIEVSCYPRNNETWVSTRIAVLIDFNTEMDAQSVNSAFKMVDSELNEVTGDYSWHHASRIEFRPHSALATNEKYTVTIDTSARDARGAKLLEPYQSSFTTQPLLIVSTSPNNKETGVSRSATITIAFNTDMDMESVVSAFQMVDSELNDVVGHFIWPDPGWLQFQPDPPLAPSETYTVTIAATAADRYGKTLGAPYSFWFKTQP